MPSLRSVIALLALATPLLAQDDAPLAPEKLSDKEIIAQVRQLTQEEVDLSKVAVERAGGEKVKSFATRLVKRQGARLEQLAELATAGEVKEKPESAAQKDRRTTIEKLQGEGFDADYLKLLLESYGIRALLYERLAEHSENAKWKEFARDALSSEKEHLETVRKLAEDLIPEAK